jgi:hypothetical protein
MNSRRSRKRGTRVTQRVGTPVVITTTTDEEVFADDETRFVSCWIDISREQSLAILEARARGPKTIDRRDLPIWRAAMSLLKYNKARHLPLDDVRVRRDWDRFITFCSAIALCRSFRRQHANRH